MAKITKRTVDALKPKASGDLFVWDSELRGFGIRMKPSGVASYLIQYRNQHGETRRLALGKVGTLTPDEGRASARRKLAEVAEGADPSKERKAARGAITVAELCDWYLEQARAGRLLGKNGRRIKASTLDMDESRIEAHVKPLLGQQAVAGLTLDDVEQFQADIAEGRTSKRRPEKGRGGATTGGAGVAGRTVGMLHTIFVHGLRRKKTERNPADGVRKIASGRRKRRLSVADLAALGQAMDAALQNGENATGLAAIRALVLTGFRRMEVLGLRREWIHERERSVHFPDTKTGEQIRPIGRAALNALKTAPRRKGSPYVFPSDVGDGHFIGVVRVLERVAARAGLKDVSPHVLRHTFASIAGDLGFSKLTVAGLLGHAAKGDTESYVHLDTALLTAADKVSEHIAQAMAGALPSAEVIELAQATGR